MNRFHGIPLALCPLALVSSMGGCCSEVTGTQCLDWDEPATCPAPEVAAPKLGHGSGTVTSSGTFWPAHEYQINGARKTEPAACCYEVTSTVCSNGALH